MKTSMEPEPSEKGQRRKLKRVVQKKKKINLNNSASVVYYKKVKAALNASLNTSWVSHQTLKANNKALAQSLQHVKQELRHALNENGRLKVENQELTMKLLRLENQMGFAPEQPSYEQRLQGLKAVLNDMSRHLLDLGNCVSDGMDLCLVSPRTSQTSASRPQSMEEFRVNETEELDTAVALASGLNTQTVDSEAELDLLPDDWEGELHGDDSDQKSVGKLMTPNMSIIMEQSVLLDSEEGLAHLDSRMGSITEEPSTSSKSRSDGKNAPPKLPVLTKLPQRVRNGGNGKSSSCDECAGSSQSELKMKTSKTVSGSMQTTNKKTAGNTDGNVGEKCFVSKSPTCLHRLTFVVSRNMERIDNSDVEISSTGSIEDIASMPMPDLVSASPMKDEKAHEVFESKTEYTEPHTQQDAPSENSPVVPVTEDMNQSKLSVENKELVIDKEKRKSTGKKAESSTGKNTKGTTNTMKPNRTTPPSEKDIEFFISNPCALNLVHKRVTGSSEGCLDPGKQSHEQSQPVSTVDQFMAHIKESNRQSTKLASFLVVDDIDETRKSRKSTENSTIISKSRRSSGSGLALQSDQTVYFDTDMEFTEVLPPAQNLVAAEQIKTVVINARKEETKPSWKSKRKEKEDKTEDQKAISNKPGLSSKLENADRDGQGNDDDKTGADKKLAVALRVSKPGQMVFAASRKEEDGSRKAIPAKLQTKARSKSKKHLEEMVKNLPRKEPECIFDFHDKTPRPAAIEGKANQQGSVFDLSLNDTMPGTAPSLASLREKLKVISNNGLESTKGAEERDKAGKDNENKSDTRGETVCSVLLGDAPAYTVPLKDDESSQPEPRPCSRGRSLTRRKGSSRQSRSQSRSRKEGKEKDGKSVKDDSQSRPSRSKSHGRIATEVADNITDTGDMEENRSDALTKRKSEPPPNDDSSVEKPRQSARSRSRTCRYTEDDTADESISFSVSSEQEKNTYQGRSRSKARKDDDEEYKPSGRSRSKKNRHRQDENDQTRASDIEQQEMPVQHKGRSRSRRRVKEDQSSSMKDETQTSTVSSRRDENEQPMASDTEQEEVPLQHRGSDIEQQEVPVQGKGRSRSMRRLKEDQSNSMKDETQTSTVSSRRDENEQPTPSDSGQGVPLQHRGRSRSRRQVKEDQSSRMKDETQTSTVATKSVDNLQEPRLDAVSNEIPTAQQSSYNKVSKKQWNENGKRLEDDKEAGIVESDESDREPFKLVTDRRQRSKSSYNKLYSEADMFDNPFGFSAGGDETFSDSQQSSVSEKQKSYRTKSSGNGLVDHEDKNEESSKGPSEDSRKAYPKIDPTTVSLQKSNSPGHGDAGSEKRKAASEHSGSLASCERQGSPIKKLRRETENTHDLKKLQPASAEEMENAKADSKTEKQKVNGNKDSGSNPSTSSPITKRRRKSSLPVAVFQEDKAEDSPATLAKAKSKISKLSESKSAEKKNKYPLEFEELKRKLKELDQTNTVGDSNTCTQPAKKSRPLVLSSSISTAALGGKKMAVGSLLADDGEQGNSKASVRSKKAKSQPGSPKAKKSGKFQPGSPVPKTAASAVSSVTSSPRLSETCSSMGITEGREENAQAEGRRGRRAAASVCYKEPSLNAKLRRGDPHTTFLHREQMMHIYKSPKTHRKHGTSETVDRGALHDLTNMSIIEVD